MTVSPDLLAAAGLPAMASLDPDALYGQLCAARPDLQPLLAAMRQGPPPARTRPTKDASDAQRLERLKAMYGALYERMDALAAALGACPRCWGEDATCPRCEGSGEPGAALPDPAQFRRYVMPALGTIRAARASRRAHTARSPAADTITTHDSRTHQTSEEVA